jgi:hypothetical protein
MLLLQQTLVPLIQGKKQQNTGFRAKIAPVSGGIITYYQLLTDKFRCSAEQRNSPAEQRNKIPCSPVISGFSAEIE